MTPYLPVLLTAIFGPAITLYLKHVLDSRKAQGEERTAASLAEATGRHAIVQAEIADDASFRKELWARIESLEARLESQQKSYTECEQRNARLETRIVQLERDLDTTRRDLETTRRDLEEEKKRTRALYQENENLRRATQ